MTYQTTEVPKQNPVVNQSANQAEAAKVSILVWGKNHHYKANNLNTYTYILNIGEELGKVGGLKFLVHKIWRPTTKFKSGPRISERGPIVEAPVGPPTKNSPLT